MAAKTANSYRFFSNLIIREPQCSKPDGPCQWKGPNLGVATHRNRLTGVDQQRSERIRTRQDPPCHVS